MGFQIPNGEKGGPRELDNVTKLVAFNDCFTYCHM